MIEVPNCFYRLSIKALVLNDTRDKFLICQKENGMWDLPGGGLDWDTKPQEDLQREIQEEMGLNITKVADRPSYFVTEMHVKKQVWKAKVVYETELEHLDFTPSDECLAVRFVNKEDLEGLETFPGVKQIAEQFKPEYHSPSSDKLTK